MGDITELNSEELAWVRRSIQAYAMGSKFAEKAPTQKAAEYVIDAKKDLGY